MNDLLDDQPMGPWQIIAVATCVTLAALDGFDVLAIAFAAPGIAEEWAISRSALGIVITIELMGMGVGSVILGNVADKVGRRPIILASLSAMSVGMFVSAIAPNVIVLSISRVFTGVGIGAVLAVANASAAELTNKKNRGFAVTIMGAGFAFGGVAGGFFATELLQHYDWRSVFYLGAGLTALAIPLTLTTLPESVTFLALKRPPNALQKINSILAKLGHNPLSALPDANKSGDHKGGFRQLFGPGLARITVLLCLAHLAHIFTVYFVVKWIPKIVADMGFAASEAGRILVWVNLGGLVSAFIYGLLTRYFDLRKLAIAALMGAFILVFAFGQIGQDLRALTITAVICGFFLSAGTVAMYPLMAHYFPPNVRAGGIGAVLGFGRAGAIGGPIAAGFLLDAGLVFSQVTALLASGSLVAAIAIFFLWRSNVLTTVPNRDAVTISPER